MKKFKKLVCLDDLKMERQSLQELESFAEKVEVYEDAPSGRKEIIKRLENADAVLVSWKTQLDESILRDLPDLEYIGMACSLYDEASANVAVNFARENGISVRAIKDYGDPGVAEFIIAQLVYLLNGYGNHSWKELPQELNSLKIGIVGLGVTGSLLARCLKPFQPQLFYTSRSRKPEWEQEGLDFLSLEELLKECDVISFHVPRNSVKLRSEAFTSMGNSKILVNTSLGLPFEEQDFIDWVQKEGNFGIFDADGKKELGEDTEKLPGVIACTESAGWSAQTRVRLSQKVLQNLEEYLQKDL